MIPLRDAGRLERRPWASGALLVVLVLGYVAQHIWPALTPAMGLTPSAMRWSTLLTHPWLHATPLHLIGNLVFLFAFGPAVENVLGARRMVILFVLSGAAGGLAKLAVDPTSVYPMIGASGAISGVLAAAIVLGSRRRVLAWTPYFIVVQLVEVPIWVFVVIWLGLQLGLAWLALDADIATSPFAHLGGFLAGMVITYALHARGRSSSGSETKS